MFRGSVFPSSATTRATKHRETGTRYEWNCFWGVSHKYMHIMAKLCMQRLYRPNHSVVGVCSVNPHSVKNVLRILFDGGHLGE